jgi:hypothetical protein
MKEPTNSERLRDRMEVTGGGLGPAYRRLWSKAEAPDLIPSFMLLMHQVIRASVPLMVAAEAASRARAELDPVCRLFADYLAEHIEEEQSHDEWLLEDLEAAGLSRQVVLGTIPSPRVAAMVGAQYYWIHHHHPIGLLGYMRLLEGSPPSEEHIQNLQKRSGLPEALFRTYRLHGVLDPTHRFEMDAFLDSLPLSQSQGHLVWISAYQTSSGLAKCLADIERTCTTRVSGSDNGRSHHS